ncbi:hypothetical protein [Gemmatimonas sp.]|uniref:hypothetical protein n=1 Tax=Gemmatimonas sp. TaxID=1962908 RepID=UPI0037BFADF2
MKFFSENEGLIMGATSADVATLRALTIRTTDGGRGWQRVDEGPRPFELTWNGSFPSRLVGCVTVQNYNPNTSQAQRVVAKTTDGGKTWRSVPMGRAVNKIVSCRMATRSM